MAKELDNKLTELLKDVKQCSGLPIRKYYVTANHIDALQLLIKMMKYELNYLHKRTSKLQKKDYNEFHGKHFSNVMKKVSDALREEGVL